MEFGQTPKQLFVWPHPQRCVPIAEHSANGSSVDVIDSMLSSDTGACQSLLFNVGLHGKM